MARHRSGWCRLWDDRSCLLSHDRAIARRFPTLGCVEIGEAVHRVAGVSEQHVIDGEGPRCVQWFDVDLDEHLTGGIDAAPGAR